jgi:N-acetylglucosaminyldiphosphoundecaprenol N-acetyl-beta-D-mannosaminyltransferase
MYLRYREPTWESTDGSDAPPASSAGANGNGHAPPARTREPVRSFPIVELNGVELHAVTEAQVIDHILHEVSEGRGGVVVTPNLDHMRRYAQDLTFGALIAEADLVVADGMPLIWASRLQGTPLPERIPGSNLISTLSSAAGKQNRSIFLLGGDLGTADGAATALRSRFPWVKIAGTHFPPFGFEQDAQQWSTIIQTLSDTKPDIVYVALGSPKQEKLIDKLREVLPGAWWIGVGNSFSFLAGHVKRAPVWMQRTGLEWVHRLFQEPRRLFRRYLIVGIPFASLLLIRATLHGIPNRLRPATVSGASLANAKVRRSVPPRRSPDQLLAAEASLKAEKLVVPAPQPAPEATTLAAPTSLTAPTILVATYPPAGLRLRALVLLGGAVRAGTLSTATGRSTLDLPLDQSQTILNYWLSQANDVARWASLDKLPVRIKVNHNSYEPRSAHERFFGTFRVERDLSEYRGTGGVLHDLAGDYDDEDLLLIANASQILLDPLPAIIAALCRKGGDVGVVSHEDGTPSGIMLVKSKTLRLIPANGFVDMKEQGLPLIAQKYDVRVMRRRRPTGLPVRSLADYILALRFHHREKTGRNKITDPLAEDWGPTFTIVEEGASVDHSSRVHDSVVLRDARIESGAVLVRSLVCPGMVVGRDRTEVDRIVSEIGIGRAKTARTATVVPAVVPQITAAAR